MMSGLDQFLWDFIWQSTLVLLCGLLASVALRKRPAHAHFALVLAVSACLVAPLATRAVRQFDAGMLPAATRLPSAVTAVPSDAMDVAKPAVRTPQSTGSSKAPATPSFVGMTLPSPWWFIRVAWLATAVFAAGGLVFALIVGTRMLKRCRPVADPQMQQMIDRAATRLNIGSYAVAYQSPDIRVPLVWGWRLHPALLIPAESKIPELESVVVHELAHVRRYDHWVLLMVQLLRVLCPWHPLLWITAKRLDDLAEESCDDLVVTSGCEPVAYAERLIGYTEQPHSRPRLAPGARSNRSSLGARVRRILTPHCNRNVPTTGWCGAVLSAMLVLTAVLAFAQEGPPARFDEKPVSSLTSLPEPPTAEDVGDVSSTIQYARADREMAYYLIERGNASKPRPLVLVLSGGNGGPDFHTFIKRVTKFSFGEDVLVAHLIARQWSPGQFDRIVWPTKESPWPGMKYSTEEYASEVIRHVSSVRNVDLNQCYVFGWSSGGPAAYTMLLDKNCALKGAIIAMSVYRPEQLPSRKAARSKRVAILHSPDDQMAPIFLARLAEEDLMQHDAEVRMIEYSGGHGWRAPVYENLREAYHFVSGGDAS